MDTKYNESETADIICNNNNKYESNLRDKRVTRREKSESMHNDSRHVTNKELAC